MDLTPEERRRLDAYIASQNHFVTVSDEVASRIIIQWLERNLPQIIARIRRSAANVWATVREWIGL